MADAPEHDPVRRLIAELAGMAAKAGISIGPFGITSRMEI
jgi:hypothetical protein